MISFKRSYQERWLSNATTETPTAIVKVSKPIANIDAFLQSFPKEYLCCDSGGVHQVKNIHIQDRGMYLQAKFETWTNLGDFHFLWRFNALEKEVHQEIEEVFPPIIADVIFDMLNDYGSDDSFVIESCDSPRDIIVNMIKEATQESNIFLVKVPAIGVFDCTSLYGNCMKMPGVPWASEEKKRKKEIKKKKEIVGEQQNFYFTMGFNKQK